MCCTTNTSTARPGPATSSCRPPRQLRRQVEPTPRHLGDRTGQLRRRPRAPPAPAGPPRVEDLLPGHPAVVGKTVRSTSCRSATSASAPPARPGPRRRPAAWRPGCCRLARSSSSWLMNHIRHCANDNGTRSGRSTTRNGTRALPAPAQRPRPRSRPGSARRTACGCRPRRPAPHGPARSAASPAANPRPGQRNRPRRRPGPRPAPRRTASTRSPRPPYPAPGPQPRTPARAARPGPASRSP